MPTQVYASSTLAALLNNHRPYVKQHVARRLLRVEVLSFVATYSSSFRLHQVVPFPLASVKQCHPNCQSCSLLGRLYYRLSTMAFCRKQPSALLCLLSF